MAKKQSGDGLARLKADLKAQTFQRLYIFHGEERYLLEHYLGLLRKKLLDGPAQDFNFHRFPQGSVELQALTDAVESVPMMAEHTLVEIDDWDLSKLTESGREALTAILSDIPDYCTMVLVYDTVAFKVDGRYKKLKAALDCGHGGGIRPPEPAGSHRLDSQACPWPPEKISQTKTVNISLSQRRSHDHPGIRAQKAHRLRPLAVRSLRPISTPW